MHARQELEPDDRVALARLESTLEQLPAASSELRGLLQAELAWRAALLHLAHPDDPAIITLARDYLSAAPTPAPLVLRARLDLAHIALELATGSNTSSHMTTAQRAAQHLWWDRRYVSVLATLEQLAAKQAEQAEQAEFEAALTQLIDDIDRGASTVAELEMRLQQLRELDRDLGASPTRSQWLEWAADMNLVRRARETDDLDTKKSAIEQLAVAPERDELPEVYRQRLEREISELSPPVP